MLITHYLSLIITLVSILSLSAVSAAPQLAPASSKEGMSEVETKVSPDTPSTIQAAQAAKGELNPKDQKDVVEVQIIGEMLSKSGGQTIKVKVPFKHGLRRLTTPTTLKLDPSRDHIFTPVDESCHSFEPFILNLKKELKEHTGAEAHKVRLPLLPQEHLVTLSPSPVWGGKIKELSKFSVSVDSEPPEPLSKEPIRVPSCTKKIELTHPLLNSVSMRSIALVSSALTPSGPPVLGRLSAIEKILRSASSSTSVACIPLGLKAVSAISVLTLINWRRVERSRMICA